MKILAIETSCDDTSCAVVDNNRKILSNIVNSQINIHSKYNGVVPELASRHHLENINFIIDQALLVANVTLKDIDAIAVTQTPGLVGSLLVGLMTAKFLGYTHNIPVIPINHLYAHIWANLLEDNNNKFEPEFPCVVLLVSGGHTDLYLLKSYDDIEVLGRTRDDAVGEAYDKVAKLLDLGYPGGPVIDRVSKTVTERIDLPRPMLPNTYDFSFSGLKTAVLNVVKSHTHSSKSNKIKFKDISENRDKIKDHDKYIIAASFQDAAVHVLLKKTIKAAKEFKAKTIMLSGGVAANSKLREDIKIEAEKINIKVHYPAPILCTDNAAMVGSFAMFKIEKQGLDFYKNKFKEDLDFYEAKANSD